MMWRRTLGVVFLMIGLTGLIVSLASTVISRRVIDDIGSGLVHLLDIATDNLDKTHDTLMLTKSVMQQVNDSMNTVSITAADISHGIGETQPLMGKILSVAALEIPRSLEAIQSAIPDVAEAAGAIDDTLTILDGFGVEQRIFGVPIQFNLGVEYDPTIPLDETVIRLGDSLNGLPGNLRAMEVDLQMADSNLELVADNMETITGDLEVINARIAEIDPILDDYISLTTVSRDNLRQARLNLEKELVIAKWIATILFLWIGLNQIIPFYLAYDLFTKGNAEDK